MPVNPFASEAKRVARKTGFRIGTLLHTARHYGRQYRNAIYSGTYQGKPAVLKLYDEPQPTDEPRALAVFNRANRSTKVRAPKLYTSGVVSPTRGWLIMERLDAGGHFLSSPLQPDERAMFLAVFMEYRKSFPKRPHRALTSLEKLPADAYHVARLQRWLHLAEATDLHRPARQRLVFSASFRALYQDSVTYLHRAFRSRRMQWCHGHVKPKEIFQRQDGTYALTDFAHTRMYPEGYELAFIIWADWLLPGNWRLSYAQWKKPIRAWLKLIRPVALRLRYKKVDALLRASLVERILGTMLADVEAINLSYVERRGRLQHLQRLLRELLAGEKV